MLVVGFSVAEAVGSSAEQVTGNHSLSCPMTNIGSPCFSSLFLVISVYQFCQSLDGVKPKRVLPVVTQKTREAGCSSHFSFPSIGNSF